MVADQRIALCGRLDDIGRHAHAAPAVVIGVDGPLRLVAGRAHMTRAALLAPGWTHAVDARGGRIAVFLLPPGTMSRAGRGPLRDLAAPAAWVELAGAVLRGELASFAPVDALVARAAPELRPIDSRLARVLHALGDRLDANLPLAALAADAGLSPSRLMGLAHDQLGASLRSYRRWLRMFRVARAYAAGASLTRAALDAGFASSAHLSAAARAQFGIRPSHLLAPALRAGIRTM